MKPLEDVRQISALTYGFIASKAPFAALDLDLFTKITNGKVTLSALAEATATPPNRLRTLMTALRTIGLVSEAGFAIEGTESMLGEITQLTRAGRP